jgi:hypothetical protein
MSNHKAHKGHKKDKIDPGSWFDFVFPVRFVFFVRFVVIPPS